MAGQFYERLRAYYLKVAAVLRGEADAASVFPNATDIGMSRERVYAEFLRQHAPSKCNVFFGGFLFGEDGSESKQLDVLVTTDTTPQFNFHNRDGHGTSFSPVEGTLAIASIKSMLNKNELENTLAGIASIPPTIPLDGRVNPSLNIRNYDDWPYKIIYASDGISAETLLNHLNSYYLNNPNIPLGRRPNIIHVSGKYVIFRALEEMRLRDVSRLEEKELELGSFVLCTRHVDVPGMLWVLDGLQQRASLSTHILYKYSNIINQVNDITARNNAQQSVDGPTRFAS